MDYKSSFKSHQQFKTNTIYYMYQNFAIEYRRSSTVDGGEVISEIEASNTMYTLFHVKNCFTKDLIISEGNEGCLLVRGGEIFSLYIKTYNVFVLLNSL